jgi:pimeloyl-ACP methyl ester carboxylesterase
VDYLQKKSNQSRSNKKEGLALLALLENRDQMRTPALIDGLPAAIRADIEALNLANKDLSRLRARLILLHGTDDAIIPYTESLSLAASVPPERAELFFIDGLAHVDVRPLGLDRRAIHALLAQRNNPGEGRR